MDTTLYEIYQDLGVLEIMQSADVQQFVTVELKNVWFENGNDTIAA